MLGPVQRAASTSIATAMDHSGKSERQDAADGPLRLLHGTYLQDWLSRSTTTTGASTRPSGGGSRAFGDIGVHWLV